VFLGFERLIAEVSEKTGVLSAVCFALAAMTRPEGVLLFATAALFRGVLNISREWRFLPRRQEVLWLLTFLVLFLPYYIWRWRYYGWPFPNTFYVKTSGGAGTWELGGYYLRRFAEDYGAFFFILLGVFAWPTRADRRRRSLFVLTALVWGVFALYTVSVGGDFMGLYRFILPVVPLGAVALQEALRVLWSRLEPFTGRPVLALAGAMVAGGFIAGSAKVSQGGATIVGADNGIDTPASSSSTRSIASPSASGSASTATRVSSCPWAVPGSSRTTRPARVRRLRARRQARGPRPHDDDEFRSAWASEVGHGPVRALP
jgi:hypothetical protein